MRARLRGFLSVAAIGTALVMMSGCSRAATPSRSNSPAKAAPAFAIDQNFPDPDIMKVGQTYFAYATNSAAVNVQVATSTDLKKWTVSGTDALPTLPDWTAPGKTWAPDVSEVAPGQFIMYFVAANLDPSFQCISVALSDSPTGPFVATGTGPLVCPSDEGGAIDPATFTDDDGTRYLVWKNDGNCCGLDTWLQIAPLAADGLTFSGPTTKLVKQTLAWEGNLVEAPTLVKHGARYVLLYSSNDYSGAEYTIGYATSPSLLGPYTKHPEPLLTTESSGMRYTGPGGQDVVTTSDGSTLLAFHSWSDGLAYRGMNIVPLTWKNDEPVVVLP